MMCKIIKNILEGGLWTEPQDSPHGGVNEYLHKRGRMTLQERVLT